mgnify:FL=1|nr:MAG TPA: hypothetical protein [Caudoviricetes sp.]DAT69866.1 MAG TPA: hypothetical protein [Caudoviricetes sp.]
MKEIDERYIAALDEFGFGMFRTKAGVNIYHTISTGTFMANLNGEDFVDMLVSYAETFDPNTWVSWTVKSHSSTQDISAMLKNAQEIQILLLRLAIKLVKISKEVE